MRRQIVSLNLALSSEGFGFFGRFYLSVCLFLAILLAFFTESLAFFEKINLTMSKWNTDSLCMAF